MDVYNPFFKDTYASGHTYILWRCVPQINYALSTEVSPFVYFESPAEQFHQVASRSRVLGDRKEVLPDHTRRVAT